MCVWGGGGGGGDKYTGGWGHTNTATGGRMEASKEGVGYLAFSLTIQFLAPCLP